MSAVVDQFEKVWQELKRLRQAVDALRAKDDPVCIQGNWTPTIVGQSTAGTQTYSVQFGRYQKRGKLCSVQCYVQMTAKDAATAGNIVIAGLPFAAVSASGYSAAISIGYFEGLATSVVFFSGAVFSNTSIVQLYKLAATGGAMGYLTAADIGAGTGIIFACTYEAAS